MSKDQLFTGQPIFSQLLNFIERSNIARISQEFESDRYCKKFTTYNHLVTMLYCIYHNCTSIREVTTGMQACFLKIKHLGMNYCPRRSTLSDSNKSRSYEVFEAIYNSLYASLRQFLPDSRKQAKWYSSLYIADSTTISLFKEILKNAGKNPINGKRKGGIKVHTLIKADEDVPCVIKMNAAASHDVQFIKNMGLPRGSIITFDKGYVDYQQYDLWTQQGVIWITRMRAGAQFKVIQNNPIDDQQYSNGIHLDQHIILGHTTHKNNTRTKARLILYFDSKKNRTFTFITNDYNFKAIEIANIYKNRWQIELLYKRIKQNYPLQYFLGDNENAIKIQIWCVLIADLLLNIVRSKLLRKWSAANLCSMIRIHLMTYIHLFKFLESPESVLINNYVQANNARGPTLFD
ncbi:MAG: IS4 family transposase [Saprospiraceae bacterium]